MRWLFRIAFPAALVLMFQPLIGPTPQADAQQPPEVRVARLIRQLGDRDYRVRKNAQDELAKIGRPGKSQLSEAAGDDDPEIRIRASRLLRQLEAAAIWAPSSVSIEAEQEPVANVLKRIAEQTDNHVLAGEGYGNFDDKPVSLKLPDTTFWQAVDQLCRQSGNHVRPHYNPRRPGLVLVSGAVGNNPMAYCGPVRAQITSARRVFIEQLDYDEGKSEVTHTFQLNMQMMWEDRFSLVAYRSQPELVEAITDTGVNLPATQPGGSSWNVAGGGIRQLTASLRLHPPPASAKRLSTFRLRWGLIAVGDKATLEIRDLTPGRRFDSDDAGIVLEKIEPRNGSRYVVELLIARDLVVPEPQEVLLHENELEMFDAEGRAFSPQGQTNTLADGGARMRITFQAPEEDIEPHLIRVSYPRIRSQRDLEIVFKDVPLPVGRPE